MIQWEEGDFPAKIWGFIDLTSMPEGAQVQLPNNQDETVIEHGVYAVVESGEVIHEEDPRSDIWSTVQLETKQVEGHPDTYQKRFYLVDTEAFKDPITVIPNIGSESNNEYLLMTSRRQWAQDFMNWLDMPHHHDTVEMNSPSEEEEEETSEEEEDDESESELENEEQGEEQEESSDDEE